MQHGRKFGDLTIVNLFLEARREWTDGRAPVRLLDRFSTTPYYVIAIREICRSYQGDGS
jgi:hypothetical protein